MKKSILIMLAILMCVSIAGAYATNYEPYIVPKPPIEPPVNWGEDYFAIEADPWLSLTSANKIVFFGGPDSGTEILVIELDTGDIYWRGRLVGTDKELVDALNDVVNGFVCPKCKEMR